MGYSGNAARPLPEDATVRYVIDTTTSTFTVQAFPTGLLSSFGHSPRIAMRSFEGDAEFVQVGPSLEDARLRVQVHPDSFEVLDDISDKDRKEITRLMHEEVLETDRFPEIVYECSRVSASGNGGRYWIALNGELTLHGTTRALMVPARVTVQGDSLSAAGEFSMRQSDFGMKSPAIAAGALRIKDEVKFTFNIVARRQE